MNPIYRFFMPGKSTNLLNPETISVFSIGTNISDFIEVVEDKTYLFKNRDNENVTMIVVTQFAADYTPITTGFNLTSLQIPTGTKYIKVVFNSTLNPVELGVFLSPYTAFEKFSTNYVHPIYKNDLGLEYALESNQEFYRGKLSGKLTFQMDDYAYIQGQPFDTQFNLIIDISYNRGATWQQYWYGKFWKTDCEIDDDNKTAIVTPNVNDAYIDVLAGMDKEFNLIELAPVIQPIKFDKRSLIQIYVPGQKTIGCFLSNMWWEQECEQISDENELINTYYFKKNISKEVINVSGNMTPELPSVFIGDVPVREGWDYSYHFDNGDYRIGFSFHNSPGAYYDTCDWSISRISDGTLLWSLEILGGAGEPIEPYSVTLNPVSGSGATGTVTLDYAITSIFARRISDKLQVGSLPTYPIPDDDIVANNRNYTRVIGVDVANQIIISNKMQSTPTEWGIYQPGQYYVMPYNALFGPTRCYPIARNTWSNLSYWFAVSQISWQTEYLWRTEFELKDAYPIYSVISVLLNKVAPGITHDGTPDYSAFLYGGSSFVDLPNFRVFITPKSNITTSGYDQPAQNAPITLKRVLDMLRDCYRCYWWIDSQNRFRIEHIDYFRRGGTYSGTPVVGTDLTKQVVTRNGKMWAYASKKYKFDKPEMTAYYQFGWMDNETELFNGLPIEIVSKYVNPDKVETIEISQFSSDIDYMLLDPADISQDGFALLVPVLNNGVYKLPYMSFNVNHVDYELQNAYAAFVWLQLWYRYDMPGLYYKRNGETERAKGVKKLKNQTIKFPALHDPDLTNLIKTTMGNGTIQKITINLSSRNANATLKYDTE